jgi:hypothetical protein
MCTKLCAHVQLVGSEGYYALLFCTSRRHDIRIAHRLRQSSLIYSLDRTPVHTFPSRSFLSSMTVQSEQVLTVLQRIQNSVEVISTSQKQSQDDWKDTFDVLTQLVKLVRGCESRGSQVQPALSGLQRCCNVFDVKR